MKRSNTMVRYYILIKRKNSKRYLGAIPARLGISLSTLRKSAKKQIKPGFTYKIITEAALRKVLPKLLRKPKSGGIRMPRKTRKTVKRRTQKRMRRKKNKKNRCKKRRSY